MKRISTLLILILSLSIVKGQNIKLSQIPAFKSVAPYRVFGRSSGTGPASFLSSLDSNSVPSLHSQNYYDLRYAGISANNSWSLSGNTINPGTDFLGTTGNNSVVIKTNNVTRIKVDSVGSTTITSPSTGTTTITGGNTTISGDNLVLNGNTGNAGVVQLQKSGSTYLYLNSDNLGLRLGNGAAPVVTVASRDGMSISNSTSNPSGNPVNTSSMLDVRTTNKGVLLARLTTTQRDAIQIGIQTINVTSGGTGYTSAPSVTIGTTTGNGGGATAVISGGSVVSVTVTNNGAYSSAPTITFSGGGGSGAAATAVVGWPEGLEFYNLTLHQKQYWNGTAWISY